MTDVVSIKPTEVFEEFPKIARLNRDMVVTEKIDGINAVIAVDEHGRVRAGTRSQWVTPEHDTHGFAKWVDAHKDELRTLGPGKHFGEWWGSGVRGGYGLTNGEKRFSLFNVGRWCPLAGDPTKWPPRCCEVVPVLYRGLFSTMAIDNIVKTLRATGSRAVPGFMRPEGVVIFHEHARTLFKVTLEKDELPKSLVEKSLT